MILLVALAVILFLLAFITKSRFGVLGLALCAGSLLAGALTQEVAQLVEGNQVNIQPLSSTAVSSALLIIGPSLLLLIGGPKYSSKKGTILGSIGYALLASLLLLGPLSGSLAFDTVTKDVLQQVARYESLLIAVAVILAIIDMWLTHMPKLGKDKKH